MEKKEEAYRKKKEVVVFNEMADMKEAKDKQTFMQVMNELL